jgi:hypothetical protein
MGKSDHQKKHVAGTALQRGRIERLKEKQEAQDKEMAKLQQMIMIPDGHVETSENTKLLTNEKNKNKNQHSYPN